MSDNPETGWLADFVYTNGAFESDVAMFADSAGKITRFSRDGADLLKATRLSGRAMLPGLVNVHSHAFQRVIRGRTEYLTGADHDNFWTWRTNMYLAANKLSPDAVYHAARMAFLEMVLSGITTVGEFHYLHHLPGGVAHEGDRNLLAMQVLRAAQKVGLRIALLRTAYVRGGWQQPASEWQLRFVTPRLEQFIEDTELLREVVPRLYRPGSAWVGVAPHSVRAVPLEYLRHLAWYARSHDLPLHMHVAEQPAEVEACIAEHGLRPVELLHENGLLSSRFTAIHAVHITEKEVGHLGKARAKVAACPTTERNLGDGVAPARDLYNAGVGICFGSDSNVQIDILEDTRALEYHLRLKQLERVILAPDSAIDALATRLFRSATETGAESLGAPGGALEVGRPADFFTVDLNDPSIAGESAASLLNAIVFALERTAVRDVAVDGKFLVREGRHALDEEIVREFASVQKDLWRGK
ncbi:MAG TPA: formimidoylglutamate deiminase [Bryobacteraceae bacterium]|nr:formimidoylglutamate deiminase [Bryobacteraceae bacterium]